MEHHGARGPGCWDRVTDGQAPLPERTRAPAQSMPKEARIIRIIRTMSILLGYWETLREHYSSRGLESRLGGALIGLAFASAQTSPCRWSKGGQS